MDFSSSTIFTDLSLDTAVPSFPTVNGNWMLSDGRRVEIALIGEVNFELSWPKFLKLAEITSQQVEANEEAILRAAGPFIEQLHQSYFPGRQSRGFSPLLKELDLRLVCFYPDGTLHLWLKGSKEFNNLDVDIALGKDFTVEEVRFDG